MATYDIDKSFKEWKRHELELFFELKAHKKFTLLETWLHTPIEITDTEKNVLEELFTEVELFIDYWNEAELRERFIINLVNLVNFKDFEHHLFPFSERHFSHTFTTKSLKARLHGFMDWLVAIGYSQPDYPIFFIHEYKSEEGRKLDGKGQLLAAMFTAQQLNNRPPLTSLFGQHKVDYRNQPIYGAYVVGKYWNFLVLDGKDYGISESLISTKKEDFYTIFKILKAQKQIIYSYLEQ